MLIGLTGKREVGKSEIAKILVEDHGFRSLHAAMPMKSAVIGYLMHFGVTRSLAADMVHGLSKDTPYEELFLPVSPGAGRTGMISVAELGVPGRNCRELMEKLGYQMGAEMGPEWTLGGEYKLQQRRYPEQQDWVVESVVYESDIFTDNDGILVRVTRPGHTGVAGMNTDAAVAQVRADITFVNSESSLDELRQQIGVWVENLRRGITA